MGTGRAPLRLSEVGLDIAEDLDFNTVLQACSTPPVSSPGPVSASPCCRQPCPRGCPLSTLRSPPGRWWRTHLWAKMARQSRHRNRPSHVDMTDDCRSLRYLVAGLEAEVARDALLVDSTSSLRCPIKTAPCAGRATRAQLRPVHPGVHKPGVRLHGLPK